MLPTPQPLWPSAMRSLFLVLLLILAWGSVGARADEDSHDRALEAVAREEILPLSTILDRLRQTDRGQVLEVELEIENDRWIYEVKTLAANGVVSQRLLDARTGALLPPDQDD
jgi:uncharacterized membrane protein YkoI